MISFSNLIFLNRELRSKEPLAWVVKRQAEKANRERDQLQEESEFEDILEAPPILRKLNLS